ncbi:solute carrier organic anion transporter family member 4C1-like [Liolophura sinensis]|uniref:solute carrier organic anion transporter family member 4C1-like n=1 Tax=Liolophura sinensis TaxID=3198878 RepID=UPI0031588123
MPEPKLTKYASGKKLGDHDSPEKSLDYNESEESLSYGLGNCRPGFLQVFNNSKFLLVLLCAFACVQGFVINGINNVNTSSYERRFGLASSEVGIISSSYDISAGILVLPISFYGLRGHKIKMLTIGLAVMALGSFLMALPHFTTGLYEWGQNETSLCAKGNVSECEKGDSTLSNYLYVLIGGQLLHGAGGTTLYTIGVACIDDNVVSRTSPLYVALMYAFAALGPAIGYVLGGYFLDLYVDFEAVSSDVMTLTNKDPRWVGAWWLGFVIAMGLAILLIIPLLALPRELPSAKEVRANRVSEAHKTENCDDIGNSFTDAHRVLWRLLKNPTLICIAMAASSEGIVLSGFATFIPKFIQNQYGQTAGYSAMLTGFLVVPGAISGQIIGGYICRRFSLKIRGMLRLSLVTCLICVATAAGFWARCPQDNIAGVSVHYSDSQSDTVLPSPELKSECNAQCNCDLDQYSPVCGIDRIQYFSPCHAGCQTSNDGKYSACACINETISFPNQTHGAEDGNCNSVCPMMYVFLCLFFITVLLTFISGTPTTMVVLRCVPESQKSFAMGVQWAFARFLGTIPGPILFGTVIDSACLIWKKQCGVKTSCWIYDNDAMGRSIFLVGMGIKIVSSFFFFLSSVVYKPPPSRDVLDKAVNLEKEVSSGGEKEKNGSTTMLNGDAMVTNEAREDGGIDNPHASDLY